MKTVELKIKIEDKSDVERFLCFLNKVYDDGDFTVSVEIYDEYKRFVFGQYVRRCNILKEKINSKVKKMIKTNSNESSVVFIKYELNQK